MKEIWELFLSFFKIGLFTFGGGYAMLPLIEREVVEKHKWTTNEEILDIYSMSQCTPGVIAVNTATFIGNRIKGFWGAAFATLGVVTPSVIIIISIAALISNFADNLLIVQHAFAGIRVAVSVLIFSSCIKLFKSAIKSKVQLVLCILAFLAIAVFGVSPVVIILVCGVYGFFFIDLSKINKENNKKENKKNE